MYESGAPHALGERIVPAGVQDHQPKGFGRFDRQQYPIERKRLVVNIGVALQLRIHRDQIVGAVHLHAVASVINHRDIGIAGAVGKIAQCAPRLGRRKIAAGIYDIETGLLEGRRHHVAVIDRVRKRRHALVGGIAEHQRHALFG